MWLEGGITEKGPVTRKRPPVPMGTGGLDMSGKAKCYRARSCQKATALAAATLRESTWWDMGMRTV